MAITYDKTKYSKEIGWKGKTLQIPTPSEVEALIENAKAGNSRSAAQVFIYYRFCKSPETVEEVKTINLLSKAFNELFT